MKHFALRPLLVHENKTDLPQVPPRNAPVHPGRATACESLRRQRPDT